jgi:hypothetical protein
MFPLTSLPDDAGKSRPFSTLSVLTFSLTVLLVEKMKLKEMVALSDVVHERAADKHALAGTQPLRGAEWLLVRCVDIVQWPAAACPERTTISMCLRCHTSTAFHDIHCTCNHRFCGNR